MRLLLDTHTVVWWLLADARLSAPARAVIADPANVVYVSAASAWEVATKVRLEKMPEMAAVISRYEADIEAEGFVPIPIEQRHSLHAGLLEGTHGDPFDRMIAAQALIQRLTVVTRDRAFHDFGCEVLW